MRHPLSAIAPERRGRVFWPLALAAAGLTAILKIIDGPLAATGAGILAFEKAGSISGAARIVDSWSRSPAPTLTFGHAGLSLGLDYLYMPVYALAIALGCIGVADILRARGWPLGSVGPWLAWGVWLAALLDAIENFAMWQSLVRPPVAPWPLVALVCADIKFGLVYAGLIYALYGLIAWLAARPTAVPKPPVKITSARWPGQKR